MPSRSPRRVAALTLALAATAVATLPADAQDPWIQVASEPATGPVFESHADGDSARVRILFELGEDAAPDSVRFDLVSVTRGPITAPRYLEATSWEPDSRSEMAVLMAFEMASFADADTVDVVVEATGGDAPADVGFRVLMPRGTLSVPDTLRSDIVRWWPDGGRTPITLLETSGRSRVSGLQLQTLPFVNQDGRPTSITVTLADTSVTIAPDSGVALSYEFSGRIPIGVSRGSARLVARELAEPMTVYFEIRKRAAPWLLAVALLLGLLGGYYVRTYLQQRKEAGEARVKAIDLLTRLRAEWDKREDPVFRGAVDDQVAALQTAVSNDDADAITTAVNDAEAKLVEALTTLETTLATQQERLRSLTELTTTPWAVPGDLKVALRQADGERNQVRHAMDRANGAAAREALDSIVDVLTEDVRSNMPAWRTRMEADLTALAKEAEVWPVRVKERVTARAQALLDSLNAIATLAADADLEALKALVAAVDENRHGARPFVLGVPLWIQTAHDGVVSAFGSGNLPGRSTLAALTGAVDDLARRVDAAPDLEAALGELVAEPLPWAEAFEAQLEGLASEALDPIRQSLVACQYETAARQIVLAREALEAGDDQQLGDEVPESRGEGGEAATGVEGEIADENAPGSTTRRHLAAAPPPDVGGALEDLGSLRVRTRNQIARAKAVQFLVSAVGIGAIGYLLFSPNFQGVPADYILAFFWGFSLDVTVDSLMEQAKALPAPGG